VAVSSQIEAGTRAVMTVQCMLVQRVLPGSAHSDNLAQLEMPMVGETPPGQTPCRRDSWVQAAQVGRG
jgi:hypothetical protein